MFRMIVIGAIALVVAAAVGFGIWQVVDPDVADCEAMAKRGLIPLAEDAPDRFLGKVRTDTGKCRGGEKVAELRDTPWVDWANYWSAGDYDSQSGHRIWLTFLGKHLSRNGRGIDGALLDLERQRVELIKFNLFDNLTYRDYVTGRDGRSGRVLKTWPEMRLPESHPDFAAVGGAGTQICGGALIRHRTVTGICNDMRNPAMGSTGMIFARNAAFDETFPDLGLTELTRNRHGGRIDLLTPDPQVISRKLLARTQSDPARCNAGKGLPGGDPAASCDYKKAPFFNVLAAYWIQFMTHDWFSHLEEGHNAPGTMAMGCTKTRVDNEPVPLSAAEAARLGCDPKATENPALFADTAPPGSFEHDGRTYLERAPKTTRNTVTAWWDGSQIYGYDAVSRTRVRRDADDPAKLMQRPLRAAAGDEGGYLPVFETCEGKGADCVPDPLNPKWAGQESAAFPENWSIGMSFYHNLFVREHNIFVDAFRAQARQTPEADSGLRHPDRPQEAIAYGAVGDDDLFEIARLVVSAEIAKIHTIEWTTQLLYDEPLRTGMYSNWQGLLYGHPEAERALARVVESLGKSDNPDDATAWYSVLASGPGIVGSGTLDKSGNLTDVDYSNAGTNHFGSPFNFPEEFISVYRLHPLLPDLIEMRDAAGDPNVVTGTLPIVDTFRSKATGAMHDIGMDNLALSMGRQRLGLLALQNHPAFLQNLEMPYPRDGISQNVDVVALDIVRDRERGIPRFNEFRRQIGLRQLTGFDDFIDQGLVRKLEAGGLDDAERAAIEADLADQRQLADLLREVYGTHVCDASKVISHAQYAPDSAVLEGEPGTTFPNDCLGHPDGSEVDNIEDLDTVVGYLAETTRPHGFAISETQFQVFIINASRRLFSDRFFTSSYRPEFYSHFGLDWVNNNGPTKEMEKVEVNGHEQQVLPLKRLLMRTLPGLRDQLEPVINSFDPWARDRGDYYALSWVPRPGAESDPAFK